jgi:hypothetical protein
MDVPAIRTSTFCIGIVPDTTVTIWTVVMWAFIRGEDVIASDRITLALFVDPVAPLLSLWTNMMSAFGICQEYVAFWLATVAAMFSPHALFIVDCEAAALNAFLD